MENKMLKNNLISLLNKSWRKSIIILSRSCTYQIASSLKTSKPTEFSANLLLHDKELQMFETDYL